MDWYPHEIDSYDRATLKLSLAEDGAYSRLLRWYYKHESPIPADPEEQAAIVRVPLEVWVPMSAKIMAYFVTRDSATNGGSLHNVKCDEVIIKQTRRRRDQSERQKKHRSRGIVDHQTPAKPANSRPRRSNASVTRDSATADAPEERRGEEVDTSIDVSSSPASPLMSFDDFWKLYPRRVGKLAAERAFKRMLGKMPPADEMAAAINRTIANKKTDIDFPHPKTWLEEGRWMDVEGEAAAPAPGPTFRLPDDAPAWRKALLAQLGATKYISWIAGTEMRAAEKPGHFYVKSAFAATHLSVTFLKEIALACGCAEREIIFHVRPSKKENAK